MNKQKILDKIEELKKLIDIEESELALEDRNFRINSEGWIKKGKVLENPEGDIWEIIDGKYKGEQLFTWDAAMRKTKKAGKWMPTDEEFSELLKIKSDMPNLVFAGYRNTAGTVANRGSVAYFWSSTESGADAWYRTLYSPFTSVNRNPDSKAGGFSVRCLR